MRTENTSHKKSQDTDLYQPFVTMIKYLGITMQNGKYLSQSAISEISVHDPTVFNKQKHPKKDMAKLLASWQPAGTYWGLNHKRSQNGGERGTVIDSETEVKGERKGVSQGDGGESSQS